ncbi:MAG: glycoside hydrolase family 125 protein [Clostridia bacterium]|nr:glycoside hydrolase family 125 protein [Clostridia bacterium]
MHLEANDWLQEATQPVCDRLTRLGRIRLASMYRKCFRSTWDTTLQWSDDSVFLITGDIPAMWLRDSSAQVYHYVPHAAKYPEVSRTILGLLRRHCQYIVLDPYTNAFNREGNGRHGYQDRTSWSEEQEKWIWERKYEIDSLCYPIRLAHAFWKATGDTTWMDDLFMRAVQTILFTWETEQHHGTRSPYYFERSDCPPSDTLPREGKGQIVGDTGMTWSGFRPSDDACQYGYLIPSNFFAVKSLEQMEEMIHVLAPDEALEKRIRVLREEILSGIEKYATVETADFGRVYAYEVDGLGKFNLMDDANVPSLLSLPYLGCVDAKDETYRNTRRMVLSRKNPYYYEGTAARGIGSPHTPKDHVWPISLCIQGLTSEDPEEIRALLDMLEHLDAGTGLMHEGVHVDDPARYTRDWFAWANSIFSEFVEKAVGYLH